MNPGDLILLFLSLAFAALNLLAHGWTLNGIGPALLSTAGGAVTIWVFLSQCLSPDHSCRDAVARLVAWLAAQGRQPC